GRHYRLGFNLGDQFPWLESLLLSDHERAIAQFARDASILFRQHNFLSCDCGDVTQACPFDTRIEPPNKWAFEAITQIGGLTTHNCSCTSLGRSRNWRNQADVKKGFKPRSRSRQFKGCASPGQGARKDLGITACGVGHDSASKTARFSSDSIWNHAQRGRRHSKG